MLFCLGSYGSTDVGLGWGVGETSGVTVGGGVGVAVSLSYWNTAGA